MNSAKKKRIDQLLVEKGFFSSRERARRSLMAGVIFYKGRKIDKPGTLVDPEGEIEVKNESCPFVSRGGIKLEAALREFNISVQGRVALDAGASTGGFTHCLLKRGAKMVFAVDVGYAQLAWELRQDPRVTVLERTNLRYLTPERLGARVDLVTLDLSFISLEKIFPAVNELLNKEGEVVALVKPQFEAGPELVGKGGIVKNPAVHEQVLIDVIKKAARSGFRFRGVAYSPLCGADGNIEFFLLLGMGEQGINVDFLPGVQAVVEKAHSVLTGRQGK